MRKITLLLSILFTCGSFIHPPGIYAQQETSSLEGKVTDSKLFTELIFSVDPKNNGVNGIFLKESNTEAQLYKLKGECYRCEFYPGSIEGSFTVKDAHLKPGKKAVLTIYTQNNLMPGYAFDPGPFPPGSRFNLARIKTTVIENQKGTFKLRTN